MAPTARQKGPRSSCSRARGAAAAQGERARERGGVHSKNVLSTHHPPPPIPLFTQRLLNLVVPEVVHVMQGGRIIHTGGLEVADTLEADGYDGVKALIEAA